MQAMHDCIRSTVAWESNVQDSTVQTCGARACICKAERASINMKHAYASQDADRPDNLVPESRMAQLMTPRNNLAMLHEPPSTAMAMRTQCLMPGSCELVFMRWSGANSLARPHQTRAKHLSA